MITLIASITLNVTPCPIDGSSTKRQASTPAHAPSVFQAYSAAGKRSPAGARAKALQING